MRKSRIFRYAPLGFLLIGAMGAAFADDDLDSKGNSSCAGLPSYAALSNALAQAVSVETSGLNLQMWGTIVDRDGVVCAVAFPA
jgi:hypothetical protein